MKDFNSNEFNTKVDEVMANHVSELVNTMKSIDFKDLGQVVTGASVLSNIVDIVFNRASKNCLNMMFENDNKNDEFIGKILSGEYKKENVYEFFKDVDSDIAEDILFFDEAISLVLSSSIQGISSEDFLDML